MKKTLASVALYLCCSSPLFAGTRIIYTGFEDFTSWSPPASPAESWPFGSHYAENITVQSQTMLVVQSGNTDCAGDAQVGNSYLHIQKNTTSFDACLNGTASSVNTEANVGAAQYAYPTGLRHPGRVDSIQSNTLVVRLYFRATGEWSSGQGAIDGGGGHKFIRVYGGNGSGDDSTAMLKLPYDGSDSTPRMIFYMPSEGNVWREVAVDWQDGNWHAIGFKVTRNNNDNSENNVTLEVWVDNWDMVGEPNAALTGTVPDFGSAFDHIAFSSNWSNRYPPLLLGYDIDEFEVWDGEVETAATPPLMTSPLPSGSQLCIEP